MRLSILSQSPDLVKFGPSITFAAKISGKLPAAAAAETFVRYSVNGITVSLISTLPIFSALYALTISCDCTAVTERVHMVKVTGSAAFAGAFPVSPKTNSSATPEAT